MHQDITAWNIRAENNHGSLTPNHSESCKNGCVLWFWLMRFYKNRPIHSQKGFFHTSREDTVGPLLHVMPKAGKADLSMWENPMWGKVDTLRMAPQGCLIPSDMVSRTSGAPFSLDFLLKDKIHLVLYYFQLELLTVNKVQLKYDIAYLRFSFQSLRKRINPT